MYFHYIIKLLLKKSANNRKINFETSYIKRNSLRKTKGVSFDHIYTKSFCKAFLPNKIGFCGFAVIIGIILCRHGLIDYSNKICPLGNFL